MIVIKLRILKYLQRIANGDTENDIEECEYTNVSTNKCERGDESVNVLFEIKKNETIPVLSTHTSTSTPTHQHQRMNG